MVFFIYEQFLDIYCDGKGIKLINMFEEFKSQTDLIKG